MLTLTVFGVSGLSSGISELSGSAYAPAPTSRPSDAAVAEVVNSLGRMPMRRPLAVANGVVSVLLLVASVLLMLRRASAPWWISQAAIANCLWTIAETASQITQLLRSRDALARVLESQLRAAAAASQGNQEMPDWFGGGTLVWGFVAMCVVSGAVRIAIYVWLFVRSRRPDLQEMLAVSP